MLNGAVAGAIVLVLVWAAGVLGLEIPGDVAAALTTIVTAGVAYLTPTGDWEEKS